MPEPESNNWDDLLSEIGATPAPERQPEPPKPNPLTSSTQMSQSSRSIDPTPETDWNALVGGLGIEVRNESEGKTEKLEQPAIAQPHGKVIRMVRAPNEPMGEVVNPGSCGASDLEGESRRDRSRREDSRGDRSRGRDSRGERGDRSRRDDERGSLRRDEGRRESQGRGDGKTSDGRRDDSRREPRLDDSRSGGRSRNESWRGDSPQRERTPRSSDEPRSFDADIDQITRSESQSREDVRSEDGNRGRGERLDRSGSRDRGGRERDRGRGRGGRNDRGRNAGHSDSRIEPVSSSNDSSYSNEQDRVVDPSSSSFLKDSVGDTSALDPHTADDRFLDEPESQSTKSVNDASRELWGDSEGGSRASGFDIFNLIDEQFGGPPEIVRSEPTDEADRDSLNESSGRPREIDDLSPFDEVCDELRADGEKDEDNDRSDRPRGKRRRRRRGGKNRRGSRDEVSTSADELDRDSTDRDSIDRPPRSDLGRAADDHLLDAAADLVDSEEKSDGEREGKRGGRGRRRRGGRGRRREGSRSDSGSSRDNDREPAMAASSNGELNGEHDDEDHHIEHFHRDVTPWKEAINFIVNVNMEARSKSPNHERGRGGRGGKGGRPPRH